MSDIIQLTDTARLVVEQEVGSTNPRKDWDMLTGFVKIEGRGDSRVIDVEPVHEAPIPIQDAHERLSTWHSQPRFTPHEGIVERWARIFHGMHIEYDSEHGGYWFVDPAGFRANFPAIGDGNVKRIRQRKGAPYGVYDHYEQSALETQAEVIEQERETYRQWAEGEVYIVSLERLERYVRVVDSGSDVVADDIDWDSTKDEWETVESIGGNYLDDIYSPRVVADEHFGLTPEEFIALDLPGSPLSGLALHTIDDIRAAEDDVPLINERTGRLTPAGELYLREYQRHEDGRRETPAEAATGVSGEW